CVKREHRQPGGADQCEYARHDNQATNPGASPWAIHRRLPRRDGPIPRGALAPTLVRLGADVAPSRTNVVVPAALCLRWTRPDAGETKSTLRARPVGAAAGVCRRAMR